MWQTFLQTRSALMSLFILVLGSGLLMTLIPLRMHWLQASTLIIGSMTAAYYAGLVAGSFNMERFIVRVGHIRAFACFASGLAVLCMLHGIWVNAWFWVLLRFLGGFCTAGLFIVIESWLLSKSTLNTRGQILGLYMIALYAAQALGQLLLNISNPNSLIPFCLASMLASLAVIPLAMTKAPMPEITETSTLRLRKLFSISPTGVMGCFIAGLILSVVYGLTPLLLGQLHFPLSKIAFMMALVVFGGMALQYPIGRLSDFVDRRLVLIAMCVCTIAIAIALYIVLKQTNYSLKLIGLFLLGGFTFTFYPLSISHACDVLDHGEIVAGTQSLLLVYSIGATLGPIIAAVFMNPWLGPMGLILYFIVFSAFLIAFLLWRKTVVPVLDDSGSQDYVNVPHMTPIAVELDPRTNE